MIQQPSSCQTSPQNLAGLKLEFLEIIAHFSDHLQSSSSSQLKAVGKRPGLWIYKVWAVGEIFGIWESMVMWSDTPTMWPALDLLNAPGIVAVSESVSLSTCSSRKNVRQLFELVDTSLRVSNVFNIYAYRCANFAFAIKILIYHSFRFLLSFMRWWRSPWSFIADRSRGAWIHNAPLW